MSHDAKSSLSATLIASAIVAALSGVLPAEDAGILEHAAARLEPRERTLPSTWAEENVTLTSEQTDRPGPFNCDWKPWTRDAHDALFLSPEKIGEIDLKPAQVGWSRVWLNRVGCQCDTDPGPTLYLTFDDEKSKTFANDEFKPMVEAVGVLSAGMRQEVEEKGRRIRMHEFPVAGGKVIFCGAGSEGPVIGTPFRRVYLDEFEASNDNFPAARGDLFVSAQNRTRTYRLTRQINLGGHPRREHQGLHKHWSEISDRRRWCFDCPHCEQPVFPSWHHVRYAKMIEDADGVPRPDPASAELVCHHCGVPISDRDRAREVWPARLGGSGRFVSELEPAEAHARPYLGLWVTRLADPDVTVVQLARELASCTTEAQEMDWWNKTQGEPYRGQSGMRITDVSVRELLQPVGPGERIILPDDVAFITGGVDVQAPEDSPTLYWGAVAWSRRGIGYTIDLKIVAGGQTWAALDDHVSGLSWTTRDGRVLTVRAMGVDAGWATGQVLDYVRVPLLSSALNSYVEKIAVKYDPQRNAGQPALLYPEAKRVDIKRPWLGALKYYGLHRNTWVHRFMTRITGKRLIVLCPVPDRFVAHVLAQYQAPVAKQHDMEPTRVEWTKPKNARDDYARLHDYAEAVAAIELGLDDLRAEVAAASGPGPAVDFSFAGRPGDEWPGGGDRGGLDEW